MSKQVTTNTPKLFIGLDIHKKSWRFHFRTDLFSGSGHTFPPDIDKIKNYVIKNYADYEVSIAYEVGCFGYKPARSFESFGWDTYVVNPADIPRPSKSKFMKTDKIDAKNIAQQLKSGNLKKITIPEPVRESLRALTRQRTAVVRDYRRIKSRIKSLLTYYQIAIPEGMDSPKWSKRFLEWLAELDLGYANSNRTLKSMLNQYHYIDLEIKELSNEIRRYCKIHHLSLIHI